MASERKWVIVTGASSGIGAETVRCLLDNGYSVIATARNRKKMEEMFDGEENIRIIAWDLSEIETIQDYAKAVESAVGPVSGLVHSAGIQAFSPVQRLKSDKIRTVFHINTFAGMCLVSEFSKKNRYRAGEMSVVLLSSISAHCGADGNSIYAASKGAVEGFVSGAASELAGRGIRINALVPGRVQTPMVESFTEHLSEEEFKQARKAYPLGWGEPRDIAAFTLFLLGSGARWITGQNFVADGGHTVRTSR